MSASSDLSMEILDHIFGGGSRDYAAPNIFLAVSVNDPSDAIREPSDSAYERLETIESDWTVARSNAPGGAALNNDTVFQFSDATEDQGVITHFALFSAQTVGVRLGQGSLTTEKTITTGDALKFPVSDLDVTFN